MPFVHISEVDKVVQPAKVQPTNGHGGHKEATRKHSQAFDHVFSGPEQSDMDTAEAFGDSIVLSGLRDWRQGGNNGKRFQHATNAIRDHEKSNERILIVMPRSNVAKLGKIPQGTMFRWAESGLEPATDNKEAGIYVIESGSSATKSATPQPAPGKQDFASTRVDLPKEVADKIREFAAKIPDESLAENGREPDPHVTVLYGLHSDDSRDAAKTVAEHGHISASMQHLSLFPADKKNPKHDILKIGINSPGLHSLHGKLSDAVQNTQTFSKYAPHATVAYLKPGEGKKFTSRIMPGVSGKRVKFDHVVFSSKDEKKTKIALAEPHD